MLQPVCHTDLESANRPFQLATRQRRGWARVFNVLRLCCCIHAAGATVNLVVLLLRPAERRAQSLNGSGRHDGAFVPQQVL